MRYTLKSRMLKARYTLLLLIILLTGCASLPNPYAKTEPQSPAPESQVADADPQSPTPSPQSRSERNTAVIALANRAQSAFEQGRLEQAAATLERALDIDSDDAGAWLMLGWVRLGQSQYEQAKALAGRAGGLQPGLRQRCLADALAQAAGTSDGGWPRALELYRRSNVRCTPQPA